MSNSIIILNYNSFKDTYNLVKTILLNLNESFNIIIIDNNSIDKYYEDNFLKLIDNKKNIFYIKNGRNSGYASGNNIGLKKAIELKSKYAFILNPDIEIKYTNIFSSMIEEADKINDFTIMGPKIDNIIPYYTRPNIASIIFPPLLRIQDKVLNLILNKKIFNINEAILNVYKVYGCFMLVSLEILETIDFFDEETFLYGEENILGEKLFLLNKNMYYTNKFLVTHRAQGSTKHLRYKQFYFMYQSEKIYLLKYRKYNSILTNAFSLYSLIFRVLINKIKGLI